MNIKKVMSKTALVAVSVGLVAVSAHAGPPRDSGKYDIIGEAQAYCAGLGLYVDEFVPVNGQTSDEVARGLACSLLKKTDGELALDKKTGCVADGDNPVDGNGQVKYQFRNCAKNEAALERQAGSIVRSISDIIDNDKLQQSETAAKSACMYMEKATDLIDVSKKLVGVSGFDPNQLVSEAQDVLDALGDYDCEELLNPDSI